MSTLIFCILSCAAGAAATAKYLVWHMDIWVNNCFSVDIICYTSKKMYNTFLNVDEGCFNNILNLLSYRETTDYLYVKVILSLPEAAELINSRPKTEQFYTFLDKVNDLVVNSGLQNLNSAIERKIYGLPEEEKSKIIRQILTQLEASHQINKPGTEYSSVWFSNDKESYKVVFRFILWLIYLYFYFKGDAE